MLLVIVVVVVVFVSVCRGGGRSDVVRRVFDGGDYYRSSGSC